MINLKNIDCMEHMKKCEDNYYDLAIVDPPYGIGENGDRNKSRGKLAIAKNYKQFYGEDKDSPSPEYFNELKRISKNRIIFGANHFIEKMKKINSSCWLVWDKDNSSSHFADCELAWCSFDTAVRKFKYRWHGMLQENMKNKEVRIHPTQKPVSLYKWILQNYAKEGNKIFDSHLGSGSIAIACHDLGFSLDACELDKDYYDACIKRFNNHTSQLTFGDC